MGGRVLVHSLAHLASSLGGSRSGQAANTKMGTHMRGREGPVLSPGVAFWVTDNLSEAKKRGKGKF